MKQESSSGYRGSNDSAKLKYSVLVLPVRAVELLFIPTPLQRRIQTTVSKILEEAFLRK